jgi:phage recombination protein Bet
MTLPALRHDDTRPDWSEDQVALVKRTIAKGCDDDELALFMHICQRTGLDPFAKQIYAIRRWDSKARREVMTPQTSIDGYRLVAERTGRYAPGREPTLTYDEKTKQLATATSYIKKQTPDGTWHEVAATAHYSEYAQTTKEGAPTKFWQQMPRVMLSKVAEALALRRAFPMELSGIYTHEEMSQADTPASPESGGVPPALTYPEPRRAGVVTPPTSVAAGPPPEPELVTGDAVPVDYDTGEQLTLDGELSLEERFGRLAKPKEIASLMSALDKSDKSTEDLKHFVFAEWGIKSRKELRIGMLGPIGAWMAGEREPGEDG